MSGPIARGTFTTASNPVAGNAGDTMKVPSGTTTAYFSTNGVDANNTIKLQMRTTPSGAWVDQTTYSTDQTNTPITVADGQEWRVVNVTQQAFKAVQYRLTALATAATGGGGGPLPAFSLQPETTSLVAAMTASGQTPNAQRQYTIDYWIRKMKTQGVWAKLSRLWILGDTAGQSLINWKTPGTGDLTAVGSPVFTAPAAAYGAAANDLTAGFTATALTQWLASDVTLSQTATDGNFGFGTYVGLIANGGLLATDAGAYDGTGGIILYTAGPLFGANTSANSSVRALCASFAGGTAAQADGYGLHAVVRTSSTTVDFYHNSVPLVTASSQATVAPTNGARTLNFLTPNTPTGSAPSRKPWQGGFYANQALTAADVDMLYRAMRSVKEAVQYGDVSVNEYGFAPQAVTAQVVVYGFTLQSVHAAYEAARQGKTVALVGGWRDMTLNTLGGVSANGLGFVDINSLSSIGGLALLTHRRANAISGTANTLVPVEPRSVNLVLRQMLDPARTGGMPVAVYVTGGVVSATKSGTNITSITTTDGRTFTGSVFIDGTYEGDLMAAAGVQFATNREAAGSGSESTNGYRGFNTGSNFRKDPQNSGTIVNIDPFVTPGVQASGTIALVAPTEPSTTVGAADNEIQSYNFRLDLKGPNNSTIFSQPKQYPFPSTAPSGYSAATYELFGRLSAAIQAIPSTFDLTDAFIPSNVVGASVGGTYDFNNVGGQGTDYVGLAKSYVAAATYAQRETVWKQHENFIRGYLYYLTYDPDSRIAGQPARTSLLTYGFSVDHHLDPHPNDQPYWPGQLYVREFRRLKGALIWNGNDLTATDGTTPRSTNTVGTASYPSDCHAVQRFAHNTGSGFIVANEGGGGFTTGGVDQTCPLPMEICMPQTSDCTNLLVGFCLSSTHVAFDALRIEFTAAQVSQSLGMLAAQAIDQGSTVQAVTYATLRSRLLAAATLGNETAPVLPQTN